MKRIERPARKLDRRVLKMWWVLAALEILFAAAAAWAAVFILEGPATWTLAVFAVVTAIFLTIPPLRYSRWRFEIRERDLYISRGVVAISYLLIPFDRIQYVETRQGLIDRIFGLAQLVVHTAAAHPGKIPGLVQSEAEELREELSRVAGTATV
ncbi:MAG TPA: PH domain-containing protein [Actinomycetota bacterium]|nr:PH domain-containing protein [Actinomycetota bacterium]